MSFDSYVNTNKVDLSNEKDNKNDEGSSLRVKQEPTDFVTDQKPTMVQTTAGDLRIASVYSGLETKIKLENTNTQINDKSMDHEIPCKLEPASSEDKAECKDSIVKTEFDDRDCRDLKVGTPFPNSYKIYIQGELEEHVEFIKEEPEVSAKSEYLNLEMKPEPNVKTEYDKEGIEFEKEEEFLSGDEFLSENECGEDNENAIISNTNGLSSSEDEEDSTAGLNENLKELVQFDNPILGEIIDIYRNYEDLWDKNNAANLYHEKKQRLMQDICNEIRIKLHVILNFVDLEIILKIIHKKFYQEKKRRLKCELQQQEFTSSLTNFYRCDFLENHEGPFRCPYCYAILKEFQQFEYHKSQHHTNECDLCGRTFKNKRSLKCHKRSTHNVVIYFCSLCNISFVDQKSLNCHTSIKHNVNKCRACGKIFPTPKRMQEHYNFLHVVRDEKALQCKVCGKISENPRAFYYHKYTHSNTSHDCPICKKSFKRKNNLDHHIKYVHGSQKFACQFCGGSKVYKTPDGLRKHLKTCLSQENIIK